MATATGGDEQGAAATPGPTETKQPRRQTALVIEAEDELSTEKKPDIDCASQACGCARVSMEFDMLLSQRESHIEGLGRFVEQFSRPMGSWETMPPEDACRFGAWVPCGGEFSCYCGHLIRRVRENLQRVADVAHYCPYDPAELACAQPRAPLPTEAEMRCPNAQCQCEAVFVKLLQDSELLVRRARFWQYLYEIVVETESTEEASTEVEEDGSETGGETDE